MTSANAESPPAKSKTRSAPRFDLHVWGPVIALVALVLFGMSLNDQFLSAGNVTNVLARSSFIGIIAVGATFVITIGGLDLSVGSMSAFLAGLTIIVLNAMVPSLGISWVTIIFGMLACLALGLSAGFLNGILITVGRIEAFIVTLGTLGIFRSLVIWLADGGTLSLNFELREVYRPVYYGGIFGIAWPIIVFALVAILGEIAMRKTAYGRHAAAIGSNDQVARYSAIPVERVRLVTYMLQGMLVGVATIMYVPRLGSASSTTGLLWELEAIAAVIIGGTVLKGGFGRVWGTVIGVLILSLIDNILNLTDLVSPYLNGAIQGVIIILAVVLQRGRKGAA
ncbi:ABC sugar (ribose) transporter, inner membrane subunit [Fulvimarina pelagi HTCC2506]|uniref:ABC sugar (Ribose) transporter, inner membrane subunit n=2 Tax=Fulvimarina pelagi TaxID=217511 RepID=Q0G1P2_9HYPH|nr:ABC transporter permease [Fulvimarina pelagi]EAU41039.1 ABC sugar (ribose) transporter, inner membrane subunit [Fulvimarina pelagi HTCC2506]BAT30945.1 ABC sugar (ribose) transporter, inner membrane subunit [Fulvimarina pelagi]